MHHIHTTEYLYVDMDTMTVDVLGEIAKQQQAVSGLLSQVQIMMTPQVFA